jgi:hypothetical protein
MLLNGAATMKPSLAAALVTLTLGSACASTPTVASAPADASSAVPLTPGDLRTRMRTIGAALSAARMSIETNELADAATNAQMLATAFGDVERFWSQHDREDAVAWSREARLQAARMVSAASTHDARGASAAADRLAATCQACHDKYREGDPRAGYRLKPGIAQESLPVSSPENETRSDRR